MSIASLIGGLLYGHRHWRVDSAVALPRALWLLTALAVPLVLADSPVALTVAQLAPGLVLSPALILSSTLVSRGVHRDVRTQAFTWINSASAAGIAAAAALTGYLTDALGSRPVFAVAVGALLLSAITATIALHPLSSDTPRVGHRADPDGAGAVAAGARAPGTPSSRRSVEGARCGAVWGSVTIGPWRPRRGSVCSCGRIRRCVRR